MIAALIVLEMTCRWTPSPRSLPMTLVMVRHPQVGRALDAELRPPGTMQYIRPAAPALHEVP